MEPFRIILVAQVRTANLLGVAGTDITIAELKKRTPAYKVQIAH